MLQPDRFWPDLCRRIGRPELIDDERFKDGMSRFMNRPRLKCTRCEGTGQVDEKWPDPSEPGGWHRVEGTCPKCKGKGKV